MAALKSSHYSRAELDKIVNAFYDIADNVRENDLANEVGLTDETASMGSVDKSQLNFVEAKAIVYGQ